MLAMVLTSKRMPLEATELPDRLPGPGEIRVKIGACGVCRTDLHVMDGELPGPTFPIIPGHEIVGRIDLIGPGVAGSAAGVRIPMHPAHRYRFQAAQRSEAMAPTVPISSRPPF